jgi:hypothetical protein
MSPRTSAAVFFAVALASIVLPIATGPSWLRIAAGIVLGIVVGTFAVLFWAGGGAARVSSSEKEQMTTFPALDKAIRDGGWRYDTGEECFFDGAKRLPYRKVLALVPGMTLDELASYQGNKYDQLAKLRRTKKVARKKA